ncbi:transglycosylase SLT domain-containing protein [Roseobacter sp. EG26]|uniref:transglycosylase SLT domain-containing protein n=1 Tax=Roseobacter sp. EG26 TaxID=3412477 RepID=UPI003CE5C320
MSIVEQFKHLSYSRLLVVLSLVCLNAPAHSAEDNLCDQAAAIAAEEVGVPLEILRAISRTETGRTTNGRFEPWPWAINVEGKGLWLTTEVAAVDFTRNHLSSGKENIDIGCFQLNYRWHGDAFASISEMFDPVRNAQYAANFLSDLFAEKGDWVSAAGAYHSRTQEHATRYQRRFSRVLSGLGEPGLQTVDAGLLSSQQNQFLLLRKTNHKPLRGSLVPLSTTSGRSLLRRGTKGSGL